MPAPAFVFVENGSVTTPAGFLAAGVTAGFKKSGAPDFAMIRSTVPAACAGAFTTCTFAAAPVQLSRRKLAAPGCRINAVIVNSGNANACTGEAGLRAAEASCVCAAEALGVPPESVLCASTGRIGVQLDVFAIFNPKSIAVGILD